MSLTLEALIERGYFPQELPPPFNTADFAKFLAPLGNIPFSTTKNTRTSRLGIYNLARTGTLRRELALVNPVHFAFLADFFVRHWADLSKAAAASNISLTKPITGDPTRAIAREYSLDILPIKRAELRSRGKFLLKADLIRFYSSVYTHSIPWATHGKATAKRNRSTSLWGNELDQLIRNCQDGQTNGIPVGPDTSLVVAELLLSQVDRLLARRKLKGLRYLDDYELVFDSEAEALRALSVLENALLQFELHLNPSKTSVSRLPERLEDSWVTKLKGFYLNPFDPRFESHLIEFFDSAFELSRAYPGSNVLKYAVGRIAKVQNWNQHYELAEDLLMQCARVEAGSLPLVLASIFLNPTGSQPRISRRRDLLLRIISEHAPQRHSSEVAWSLWAMIALGFQLPSNIVRAVIAMEDPVCALLLLHGKQNNLLRNPAELDPLRGFMTEADLYDAWWLLAYEANVQGWLVSSSRVDHVSKDANFGQLKHANIKFYDVSKTAPPATLAIATALAQQIAPEYGETTEIPDVDLDEEEP